MSTIHAEVSRDGRSIVLVAGGLDLESVALAARRLKALTPLFTRSDPPGALVCPLTWAAVVQLSATFGDGFRPGARLAGWIETQVAVRTHRPGVTYAPPAGLAARPYQADGAALIAATGRALITDEPRTGKTITTVLGLVEWRRRRALAGNLPDGPTVVVCPASVVDPWVEHWQAWAPHVRAVAWRGPRRRELAGAAEVYVTSYETARVDAPVAGTKAMRSLLELGPSALVVDEAHYLKNKSSQRSLAVRRIAKAVDKLDGAVVALSGTPITKHTGELWPTLEALEPHAWPASERWVSRYCLSVGTDYEEQILGLHPGREAEFRLALLGQHRRVTRADVMSDLPPKVYSTRTVEIPAKWRKVYDDFESRMLAELPDGSELSVMDVLSVLTHLSSLASAAADVRIEHGPDLDKVTGEPKRHVHLDLKAPSWKVDAALEILAERPGEKVVVYAPSRQLIELMGAAAQAAGHRVGYIVGGQSAKARSEVRNAFQTPGSGLDLICATTSAGGVGITLSAAGTVVFLQRPWALDASIQAEDRAEGDLDAAKGTEVIDVITADSVESRVRAALRGKAGQLADLVQDPRLVAGLLGGSTVTHSQRKAS